MYGPLVSLSYAVDYGIAGLNPWMYHLTNLFLHLVNIVLVFFLIRSFTGRIEIAAITALLFAMHPLNVASVTPISVRNTLLYSVFYLSAYLCYLNYLKSGLRVRYLIAAFVLFALSLLSKSAAVVMPLLMVLTDWYFKRKYDWPTLREKVPFLLLSLIFGIVTIVSRTDAVHFGRHHYIFNTLERILLVSYSIGFYIFKLFLPVNLHAFYEYPNKNAGYFPEVFYLSPFFILLILYALFIAKKYKRELLFCSLFFFIHIFLVVNIIPSGGTEMVCDRYAYIPGLGLFTMVGGAYALTTEGAYRLGGRIKMVSTILLIICAGALSVISYQRNGIWKDNLTLMSDIIRSDPNNIVAYTHPGISKAKLKDYTEAIMEYNKAIEVDPNNAIAYSNRGIVKAKLKDYTGAILDYNKAIEVDPNNAIAYSNRGFVKARLNNYTGAIVDYNKAIEVNPSYATAYFGRGIAREKSGNKYGACADMRKSFELGNFQIEEDMRRICR
ncbi:MAG: tetratricopeptide repeat protein [Nitrospirae bacterium]|nr:tetratricopeptide repeat protein [Nitrospirota bacterium]